MKSLTKKDLKYAVAVLKGKKKPKKVSYEKIITFLCALAEDPVKMYKSTFNSSNIK